MKKTVQMSGYFPEPKSLGGKMKVELDFSNYATKMRQELIRLLLLKKLI